MLVFNFFYFVRLLSYCFLISDAHAVDSLPENVTQSIDRRIENGINPSVAIGIISETGTSYYNFGNMRTDGLAVDEHTIYEIGSIT